MIRWAFALLIVTIVAGLIGYMPNPGPFAAPARLLFFAALGLFVILMLAGDQRPSSAV